MPSGILILFAISAICFLLVKIIGSKKPIQKLLQLSDFPKQRGLETMLPFEEWCKKHKKSIKKRRTNRDLWHYCTDTGRPTFEDWKQIHGLDRYKWVEDRNVYEDWLKYIGAYNSKFDPSSPNYDGGDPDFVQKY